MSNMTRFENVPKIEVPRAQFDRSHGLKSTFDGDFVVPIMIEEILPGDTVKMNANYLARLATPLHPIMHDMYIDTFWFFVPNRLVWESWRRFQGERYPDPDTTIDLTVPVITLNSDFSGRHGFLVDYLGLPLIDYNAENYTVNALPARGYFRIWNEWFRDENLQDSSVPGLAVGAGPDADSYIELACLKRGKRHDYFTSCLPWLQKGDAVELPLGATAPVVYTPGATAEQHLRKVSDDSLAGATAHVESDANSHLQDGGAAFDVFIDPTGTMHADLTSAAGSTVGEVRNAFQIQRLLERDARGGTRYEEIIPSHFGPGVVPPFISWKPEYLGGSSNPIGITPIPNTDFTAGGANEGSKLSGVGVGTGQTGFVKSFSEHGYLFGLISARADLTYEEGLHRMWNRSTRYDFYMPVLANVGEQAVLNRELVLDDTMITAGDDLLVFGYQERWSEMKYATNRITGDMRGNSSSSLNPWHLGEEFNPTSNGTFPLLDADFIVGNTLWSRVQATTTEPDFILDMWFDFKHTRCMPVYSIPGMIDHF